jgi:hypothetical protein
LLPQAPSAARIFASRATISGGAQSALANAIAQFGRMSASEKAALEEEVRTRSQKVGAASVSRSTRPAKSS